jgi:hypothetical protein
LDRLYGGVGDIEHTAAALMMSLGFLTALIDQKEMFIKYVRRNNKNDNNAKAINDAYNNRNILL